MAPVPHNLPGGPPVDVGRQLLLVPAGPALLAPVREPDRAFILGGGGGLGGEVAAAAAVRVGLHLKLLAGGVEVEPAGGKKMLYE